MINLQAKAARLVNGHNSLASLPPGYETLVGERGIQLSVEQKQRVVITG